MQYSFMDFIGGLSLSVSGTSFMISIIIVLSIVLLIISITAKIRTSIIITTILTYLLSLISKIKYISLGEPLDFNDFFMINNMDKIKNFAVYKFSIYSIIAICIMGIFLYSLNKIIKQSYYKKVCVKNRIACLIFSLLIIYITCINYSCRYQLTKTMHTSLYSEHKKEIYMQAGIIIPFFQNIIESFEFENLEDYNKNKISQILNNYEYTKDGETINNDYVQPNVIVLMSESLYDVTNIKGLELSSDPLKFIHSLQEESPIKKLSSPSYAARTAIVEFELFTGFNTTFMPDGCYPYVQYIDKDIPSIVRSFKENGYLTQAIHTNIGDFYCRNKVYPFLGFDKMVFSEDMTGYELKNGYISDMYLTKEIINKFENKGDKKTYIYALSMQNHSPYDEIMYDKYDVNVASEYLSEDELVIMNNYVQGLYEADKAFEELIKYFSNVQEPTIVVLYGDHFPKLEDIPKKLNLFEDEPGEELYETPLVIWNNYEEIYDNNIEKVSPSKLGLILAEYANIKLDNKYYEILNNFYNNIYVFKKNYIIDKDNNEFINENYDETIYYKLIEDYKYIQYDILFGEGYSVDKK